MTSIIKADNISTVSGSGNITIPTGVKVVGTDEGSIVAPGNVIQMQSTVTPLFASTGATTLADLLTISFTPKFATSQLRIDVSLRYQENTTNNNIKYTVLNGSTTVYQINNYSTYHDGAGNSIETLTFHTFAAAGDTSARDIKFQAAKVGTGGTFYINPNDAIGSATRMTVMEIAQ